MVMVAVAAGPDRALRARATTRPVHCVAPVPRATFVRRRLVVALVGVVLVLVTARAGGALGSGSLAAPERRPTSADVVRVTVRPGDSLWSIATRLAPGEDPRPVVDELEQARHGRPLQPGETIEWAP
jgi:hypothetical protein